jgi:hypothetical protein
VRVRIRNRDPANAWIGEDRQPAGGRCVGESGTIQLSFTVSAPSARTIPAAAGSRRPPKKKEIERAPFWSYAKKLRGRAERDVDFLLSVLLETRGQRGKHGLKIRRGGDERSLSVGDAREQRPTECEESRLIDMTD